MLSQENGVFAFECVIQSYIIFPDYSRDSLNTEWFSRSMITGKSEREIRPTHDFHMIICQQPHPRRTSSFHVKTTSAGVRLPPSSTSELSYGRGWEVGNASPVPGVLRSPTFLSSNELGLMCYTVGITTFHDVPVCRY